MDKEIKERWLRDLRSGEFKQGRGRLRKFNGEYCCLGVLANQGALENVASWTEGNYGYYVGGGNIAILSAKLVTWSGLSDEFGVLPKPVQFGNKLCRSLTDLNDEGMSFKEIADVIEEQF